MNPVIRLATLAASAFLAAAATACSTEEQAPVETPAPAGIVAGTLEASASRPNLTLRNTTESQVGYMVVDKDLMVVAMFPPCGTNCPKLVQGAQVTVPYSALSGYTDKSTEVMVMWWTYARAADGSLQPTGAMQSRLVRL
jgi:hypothetical protein